jgi:hypothetical protein
VLPLQCEDFLAAIALPLNEEDVFIKYPTEYFECMNTVIMQARPAPPSPRTPSRTPPPLAPPLASPLLPPPLSRLIPTGLVSGRHGLRSPQEVTRYNNVLRVIHASCKELIRALKGLVVMSGPMQVLPPPRLASPSPRLVSSRLTSRRDARPHRRPPPAPSPTTRSARPPPPPPTPLRRGRSADAR